MKSFEQIAKAMFEAFKESAPNMYQEHTFESLYHKDAWIAAAKAANKEITEAALMSCDLTDVERSEISEILSRRANEVEEFCDGYTRKEHFGSVELALTREIKRLRTLAGRVNPEQVEVN